MAGEYDSIIAYFRGWDLDEEAREYLRFHARRYAFLLDTLRARLRELSPPRRPEEVRILDVGPSALTQLLRDRKVAGTIDSLGFEDYRFRPREGETHTEYDLTRAGDESSRPHLGPYEIIVMAEVIEHLPVAPEPVFSLLAGMLEPGGFLVVQTPNACSLPKRLRMLRGSNPFEMIRTDPGNPGHFREYTLKELAGLARAAGLTVHSASRANYFLRPTPAARLFRRLERLIPPTLRDGITICLRREGAGAPPARPGNKEKPEDRSGFGGNVNSPMR